MISRATYRQILASSSILLCSFIYGCKVGYTQTLTWMCLSSNAELKATETDLSWIVAISFSGSIISLIICYTLGNRIGRRQFICCIILVYILAWTLMLTTTSVTVVIVCMFFFGIVSSMLIIMGTIYIGEVSSPQNREILSVCYSLACTLGSQIEYLLGSSGQYRLLVLFPVAICVFALVLWTFMLESPCYLISVNQHEEAIQNLRWLNDKAEDEDIDEMYASVVKYIDERKSEGVNKLKIILFPDNLKLIITMIIIQCAANINCRTILWLYGSVLTKMFSETIEERVFVNVYSAVLTLSTVVGFFTVMRYRRKRLLIFGFLTTAVIQIVCAYFYFLEERNENNLHFLALVIGALLITHSFISTCTYSSALNVLKSEVFPYSVKEVCGSIMSLTNDSASFVTSKFYFVLSSTIGLPLLFISYTLFTIAGLIAGYYNINDTKGKTLHQIRSEYTSGMSGQQLHHLENKYKIVRTRADI